MNQEYRLRFDQMKENSSVQPKETSSREESGFQQEDGYSRTFTLVKKDGTQEFFNYSYLLRGKFIPDELNRIELIYTDCIIKIQGYKLQALAMAFSKNLPMVIYETNDRYIGNEDYTVTEIRVEETAK